MLTRTTYLILIRNNGLKNILDKEILFETLKKGTICLILISIYISAMIVTAKVGIDLTVIEGILYITGITTVLYSWLHYSKWLNFKVKKYLTEEKMIELEKIKKRRSEIRSFKKKGIIFIIFLFVFLFNLHF